MTRDNRKKTLTRGEARIRRAFLLSAGLIVLIVIAAAGLYWLSRTPEKVEAVAEAEIQAPTVTTAVLAGSPPAVRSTDITESAGIDFVHVNGAFGERLMPETIGSGAAFLDYDRDGDQDLFLVNSRLWEGPSQGVEPPRQALYRNDGTGSFQDVTEDAGLALSTYGMGVAVGDYDGDGWDDLYLTGLNRNHLLRNEQGRFRDLTNAAGVAGGENDWSSSAAFLDYDKDGDLDLFLVSYVDWSRDVDLEIDFRLTGLGRAYGAPLNFVGTNNRLYRNEGDGSFTDVSAVAGIQITDPVSGRPVGKGLGVVPLDYDRNGEATSAMGVDAAHFRDDQELGIAVGNFANEMASLFVTADGRPPFVDEAVLEGLGTASRIPLTFGLLFLDYDLDGRLDLLLANGHLEHEIHKVQQSQTYAQSPSLFWNCGAACRVRFEPVGDAGDMNQPLVGRGIAYADIDADGDLDVLITQNGRRPALLRNEQQTGHHRLRVRLVGRPPNTNAIGARLEFTAGGVTRYRQVMPARGYMSQVELPVTFGLGQADKVERLRILWPDGSEQVLTPESAHTTLVVEQGGAGLR